MTHWAFWLGGLALAGVSLAHWLVVGRMFAVSGRYTALVDRVRLGPPEDPGMTDAEMIQAMRDLTAASFGEDAVSAPAKLPATKLQRPPQPVLVHVLFLVSLALGGALAAWSSGALHLEYGLRSDLFPKFFGGGALRLPVVLGVGGLLTGFGTRMAGGCTSGHGLCGVSRFQPGSLVSTMAFFGTGVALSLAIARLL